MSFWCTGDTYRRKSVRNKMKEGKRINCVSGNFIKALKLAKRIHAYPENFTECGLSLTKCKTLYGTETVACSASTLTNLCSVM